MLSSVRNRNYISLEFATITETFKSILSVDRAAGVPM